MSARVLLVDDSILVLKMAAAFLKGRYEVVTASSGEEALAKAAATQPDVLVTDLNMPGRNGIETAHCLRALQQTSHVPVVVMTTESDAARIPEGFARLLKPFDAAALVESVARQLGTPRQALAR